MSHTIQKLAHALTISALLLSACTQGGSGSSGLQLPEGVRVSSGTIGDFFERRSGRIAVTRLDGNVVVIDQTGQGEVMLTRDGGAKLLKYGSGILERRFGIPVWSRDGDQVALVETRVRVPPLRSVTYEGSVMVSGQVTPPGEVVSETLKGAQEIETEQVFPFEHVARRVSLDMGSALLGSTLYVVAPDGKGVLHEVLNSEDSIVAVDWSPAGDQLGVLSTGPQGPRLTLSSVDGQIKTPLTDGADISWSWGADANTVLARTLLDQKSLRGDIKLYATDNGDDLGSVTPRNIVHATSIGYSSDGKFMIVTLPDGDDGYAMYIADQNGKLLRKLANGRGIVSYTWAPSGSLIAYIERSGPRARAGRLWLLDVNGGDPVPLTPSPVTGFFWSPDAQSIVTFSPSSLDAIDPTRNPIVLVDEDVRTPMLVQTIYVRSRQTRDLFFAELPPQFLEVLRASDRYSRMMTIWSPDSKRIVVPVLLATPQGKFPLIMQSEASGSVHPRPIAVGAFATWSPK